VEVEDDGLVRGEQGIEVAIGEAVRVFGFRHETEQIDDVDEADLQIGKVFLQDRNRSERLHRRDVARTSHDHIGLLAVVRRSPIPDADALGAVGYGIFHGEVLEVVLFVRDNDIDVVA